MKVVSYDIWDTVIRRRCHPDAVKVNVAREMLRLINDSIKPHLRDPWVLYYMRQSTEREIGLQTQAAGFDDEYVIIDVLKHWIERTTYDGYIVTTNIINSLLRTEINHEKHVIFVDPNIEELICNDGADRRIFISDFYMGKEIIFELLEHIGLSKYFDDGYVSCDIGINKRSGKLFNHVLLTELIDGNSHLHYGDNQHSDVDVPRRLGINSELYLPRQNHEQRKRNEMRFYDRAHSLHSLADQCTPIKDNDIHDFARETAKLFIGFVLYIQEKILLHKLDRVYFFTREGEFFHEIYKILRARSPYYCRLPEGELLEVSRLSTFGPSLSSLNENELMRLWNLYSTQTPGALLKSLDLPLEDFERLLKKHKLAVDLHIQYPWLDHRISCLLNDNAFIEMASTILSARKKLLLEYCMQKGLHSGTDRCAIIDIGWRGTIQDNISYLFPNTEFVGLYLGLNQLLNKQTSNTVKYAFGPNLNVLDTKFARDLLKFVAPIEMLSNSGSGSTVGYERQGDRIVAIKLKDEGEYTVYKKFTEIYQKHILNITRNSSDWLGNDAVGSDELHESAIHIWYDIIHNPNCTVANAYFSLVHNEVFGVGKFISKSDGLDRFWPLKLLLWPGYRRQFRSKLSELGWTAGYAKHRNDRLLIPVMKNFFKQ